MRAARRAALRCRRLGHALGPPARALDRPRDDVLDPAENGAAPAGRWLVGAKAVVRVDVVPAPAARLAVQQIDAEKVVQSRRVSRRLSRQPSNTRSTATTWSRRSCGSLSYFPRKNAHGGTGITVPTGATSIFTVAPLCGKMTLERQFGLFPGEVVSNGVKLVAPAPACRAKQDCSASARDRGWSLSR
jgi:hypothetical protein